jgi:hypothetical protein
MSFSHKENVLDHTHLQHPQGWVSEVAAAASDKGPPAALCLSTKYLWWPNSP